MKSSEITEAQIRKVTLEDGRVVKKITDRKYLRARGRDIRGYVQIFFLVLTVWIGIDFYLFVNGLGTGTANVAQRPPGVEGFLPISALVSFRQFILTGIVNHVHPAGLFIFLAVVAVSTFMKKGFCSWICPVGYVSESLYQLGAKLFGRNFTLPKWIDVPLRSLKYLIMLFFILAVSALSAVELDEFINSDYNRVADIKMFMFFAHISTFAIVVIGILIILSMLYKNFWCRYACPYGALLGITSLISPLKVRRVARNCIDCGKCADACPSFLPVDRLETVNSAECSACYSCVEACPVKDTLNFSFSGNSSGLSQTQFAVILAAVYFGIVGVAVIAGYWHNSISAAEYVQLYRNIGSISHAF